MIITIEQNQRAIVYDVSAQTTLVLVPPLASADSVTLTAPRAAFFESAPTLPSAAFAAPLAPSSAFSAPLAQAFASHAPITIRK